MEDNRSCTLCDGVWHGNGGLQQLVSLSSQSFADDLVSERHFSFSYMALFLSLHCDKFLLSYDLWNGLKIVRNL